MTPDRYEVLSDSRQRLSGITQKRGSKSGLSAAATFGFGGIFVTVGTAIFLIGLRFIHVDPRSVHAPDWALIVVGAVFAIAGLAVWGSAAAQLHRNRQCAVARRNYPNEPAFADYPWHPDGFVVSEWPILLKAVLTAAGITLFLSIFNWWAFIQRGPWMVKIIVSLFDFVVVWLWYVAVQQFGRALKFGHSRIDFVSFPCRPSTPFVLRWQNFGGIHLVNHGTFTLRCVEEWTETQGSGRDRTTVIVHEQIWAARWLFEKPRNFLFQEKVELRFELPPSALTTHLDAIRPVFWELEVSLDLPGLDFKDTYLVPVYTAAPAMVA